MYTGPPKDGPGRPKQYDGKIDWDDSEELSRRFDEVGRLPDQPEVRVLTTVANSPHFRCDLRVVLLIGPDGEEQVILASTDTSQPAEEVARYYRLRYQIEYADQGLSHRTGTEALLRGIRFSYHLIQRPPRACKRPFNSTPDSHWICDSGRQAARGTYPLPGTQPGEARLPSEHVRRGSESAPAPCSEGRVFNPHLPARSLQPAFDQTAFLQARPQRRVRPNGPTRPSGSPHRTHGRLTVITEFSTCTDH